jgi:hypothetical protein
MYEESVKKRARKEADTLIAKLRDGTLTKEDFSGKGFDSCAYRDVRKATGGADDFEAFYQLTHLRWQVRKYVTNECSWSIFTKAWLDALGELLEGRRVVEVCAGTGILGPLMASRGVEWICSDVEPQDEHVLCIDAFEAEDILHLQPDVIFASWIPYTAAIDMTLVETRCPLILVGESPGGCTGSEELWDHDAWKEAIEPSSLIPDFEDVLQWDGIHDHTMLLNWFKEDQNAGTSE